MEKKKSHACSTGGSSSLTPLKNFHHNESKQTFTAYEKQVPSLCKTASFMGSQSFPNTEILVSRIGYYLFIFGASYFCTSSSMCRKELAVALESVLLNSINKVKGSLGQWRSLIGIYGHNRYC